jgi:hypothetical protein
MAAAAGGARAQQLNNLASLGLRKRTTTKYTALHLERDANPMDTISPVAVSALTTMMAIVTNHTIWGEVRVSITTCTQRHTHR